MAKKKIKWGVKYKGTVLPVSSFLLFVPFMTIGMSYFVHVHVYENTNNYIQHKNSNCFMTKKDERKCEKKRTFRQVTFDSWLNSSKLLGQKRRIKTRHASLLSYYIIQHSACIVNLLVFGSHANHLIHGHIISILYKTSKLSIFVLLFLIVLVID